MLKLKLSTADKNNDGTLPENSGEGTKKPRKKHDNKVAKIRIKRPVESQSLPSPSIRLKPGKEASSGDSSGAVKHVPRIRVKAARQPGQGYDSEAPDREEDPLIEEAIVLRMVSGEHLDYLRAACDEGDLSGISIKFKDSRHAVVTVQNQMFAAKLVDLPTVIEAQKSFDRKNIYKASDICQMLLVTGKISKEEEALKEDIDLEAPTTFPHGISAPLYNARRRRFRKRLSNKVIETVEAKVDELFRLDEEAEESHYELLDPSLISMHPGSISGPSGGVGLPGSIGGHGLPGSSRFSSPLPDDVPYDMLGSRAVSPMTHDSGEEEDLLGLELEKALESAEDEEEGEDGDSEDDGEDLDSEEDGIDEEALEAIHHDQLLKEEIAELEATVQAKEKDAENATNPILRGRFLEVLNKLRQELEIKRRQVKEEEERSKVLEGDEDEVMADVDADGDGDLDDADADDDVESLF